MAKKVKLSLDAVNYDEAKIILKKAMNEIKSLKHCENIKVIYVTGKDEEDTANG